MRKKAISISILLYVSGRVLRISDHSLPKDNLKESVGAHVAFIPKVHEVGVAVQEEIGRD